LQQAPAESTGSNYFVATAVFGLARVGILAAVACLTTVVGFVTDTGFADVDELDELDELAASILDHNDLNILVSQIAIDGDVEEK